MKRDHSPCKEAEVALKRRGGAAAGCFGDAPERQVEKEDKDGKAQVGVSDGK